MNRNCLVNINFLLFSLILLSIFISGCFDSFKNLSPKEAVIKANEKLKQTSGYRMKIDTTLKIKDIKQSVTFMGEVKNPGITHLTGNLMGMELEIYQKDSTFFIKNPLTQKWSKSQDMGLPDMNNIINTSGETFNNLADLIVEADYLPDEKINNIDYKVVKYIPDKDKIKKIIEKSSSKNINDVEYTFKVWIGKKDFLIHKMNINIDLFIADTGKQSVTMMIDLYDFNSKDIDIKIPPEVSSLFN
ncbi:MAG: hypothetical protein PWR06_828 [Thermoanaerobacteraceae bacterium]|nr:hypothetical protein [Thermoanaerobacteraceae bacterium]MDN5301986.1 hypothetical protein [Thermoanaerobacteraceae bacterium]